MGLLIVGVLIGLAGVERVEGGALAMSARGQAGWLLASICFILGWINKLMAWYRHA